MVKKAQKQNTNKESTQQWLDPLPANVLSHVVVDSFSGKDDLRMIPELLSPVCQIVRVDAYAVCRPPRLSITFPI